MVSRRNFISIFIMMGVLLFMFQFSQVIKESQSSYDVNSYVREQKLSGKERWMMPVLSTQKEADYESGDFVVFLGKEDSAMGQVVAQWCLYTKRKLVVYDNYRDYRFTTQHMPEAILVDSNVVDLAQGAISFESMTNAGVTMIFCNLPKPAAINRNSMLKRLMGISDVYMEEIEVEGVHLFGDFLLGGEAFYRAEKEEDEELQDMDLTMPWYITSGGTKTYMVGMLDELLKDNEDKNELFPALIWRSNYNQGKVFVVNGDFLESMMGIGILDAMMYEDSSYDIYPVVNAQNVMVVNFPGFAGENDGQMRELYSRDTESVLRDVFWPTISGLTDRNRYHLTCLMTPQYIYSDQIEPSGSMLAFYLQQFKEFTAEAGLSLERWNDTTLEEKLERDGEFYTSLKEQYVYSALFVRNEDLEQLEKLMPAQRFLRNINTVTREYQETEPIVDYFNDDITLQSTTVEAQIHTYSDDLRVRCIETALGYSNILFDMNQVIWPENEKDQWETVSEKITSNLDTYWKPFMAFEMTSLSESDDRIRTFLNLDYEHRREGDTVYLEVTGVDEGWFILRIHGERISGIDGGDYQEIESGAYVIHAQQRNVEITLEKSRGLLNYGVE
ncbi:MAG: DUF2194 domain-containing protein [Acetatifactor sp.]|nr:DUF2194 domain-containing protein [Acetatifactor sp.]